MTIWTEKYRPTKFKDVIGLDQSIYCQYDK